MGLVENSLRLSMQGPGYGDRLYRTTELVDFRCMQIAGARWGKLAVTASLVWVTIVITGHDDQRHTCLRVPADNALFVDP